MKGTTMGKMAKIAGQAWYDSQPTLVKELIGNYSRLEGDPRKPETMREVGLMSQLKQLTEVAKAILELDKTNQCVRNILESTEAFIKQYTLIINRHSGVKTNGDPSGSDNNGSKGSGSVKNSPRPIKPKG